MSGAPLVVTGAAGFIGSHLARRLADEGRPVLALDVRTRPAALEHPGVEYRQADLRDGAAVRRLLRRAEAVFHLASVHLEVRAGAEAYRAVNVEAAADLVSACREAGVRRLVHASSVGVFGHVTDPPASEDAPLRPRSLYERSKLDGEEAVWARAATEEMDVVVLRPAWVYGPGCPRTAKLLRALARERFFYVGAGTNLRHPVYVEDVVQAFQLAADAGPSVAGRTYIVAGPRAMSLREMVEAFARAADAAPPRLSIPRWAGAGLGWMAESVGRVVGKDPPFSRRSLAFFENDNAFDTRAAQRDLGFLARVDLEEGLRRTLSDPVWGSPLAAAA